MCGEMPEDINSSKNVFWENLQLACLALTIIGQIVIGASFFFGQGLWLIANFVSLIRDFVLKRPAADKIKDATLAAITAGIIITAYLL